MDDFRCSSASARLPVSIEEPPPVKDTGGLNGDAVEGNGMGVALMGRAVVEIAKTCMSLDAESLGMLSVSSKGVYTDWT